MVGVQDEDPVHGLRQHRVHMIVLGRDREAHAQEVLSVTQLVAREYERLAHRVLEGAGRDGRHLGDHAVSADLALLQVVDVGAVVVEGRQGAHGADHDRHRVGVAAEALEEAVELLMHHGVVRDGVGELFQFLGVRQFAVQQQVADFQERRLLGQLLDGVAAIQQHALVAVDVGDLAFAGRGRGEAGVEGEDVGVAVELADVDHVRADGPLQHGEGDLLVADLEGGGAV